MNSTVYAEQKYIYTSSAGIQYTIIISQVNGSYENVNGSYENVNNVKRNNVKHIVIIETETGDKPPYWYRSFLIHKNETLDEFIAKYVNTGVKLVNGTVTSIPASGGRRKHKRTTHKRNKRNKRTTRRRA